MQFTTFLPRNTFDAFTGLISLPSCISLCGIEFQSATAVLSDQADRTNGRSSLLALGSLSQCILSVATITEEFPCPGIPRSTWPASPGIA